MKSWDVDFSRERGSRDIPRVSEGKGGCLGARYPEKQRPESHCTAQPKPCDTLRTELWTAGAEQGSFCGECERGAACQGPHGELKLELPVKIVTLRVTFALLQNRSYPGLPKL